MCCLFSGMFIYCMEGKKLKLQMLISFGLFFFFYFKRNRLLKILLFSHFIFMIMGKVELHINFYLHLLFKKLYSKIHWPRCSNWTFFFLVPSEDSWNIGCCHEIYLVCTLFYSWAAQQLQIWARCLQTVLKNSEEPN